TDSLNDEALAALSADDERTFDDIGKNSYGFRLSEKIRGNRFIAYRHDLVEGLGCLLCSFGSVRDVLVVRFLTERKYGKQKDQTGDYRCLFHTHILVLNLLSYKDFLWANSHSILWD